MALLPPSVAFLAAALALSGAGALTGLVFVELKAAPGDLVLQASPPPLTAVEEPLPAAAVSCPDLTVVDPPWMLAGPPPPPSQPPPEAPLSLERRISFWTQVWGDRGDNQHLLVDQRRPWVVFAEVDCRDLSGNGAAAAKDECGARLTQARRKVQADLKKTWWQPAKMKRYDGDKKLALSAMNNLIGIQGRRDALARAKDRAAPHLGHAEGLFALEDVPRVYARAAIVESLWRPEALSRSGAAGAYQFMPKTGRQFLAVTEGIVDERLDPLRASWAAARYMSQMAKSLTAWPLVLTAYNTGPARLRRVMKARGSADLGKLADAGNLGEFGFDGQNYYAQIAAIGRLTKDEVFEPYPITGRAFRLDSALSFLELASCVETTPAALALANPALHAAVLEGKALVPEGYVARVPATLVQTASLEPRADVAQR